MNNDDKSPSIFLKFCDVLTTRILNSVYPFFNIMNERECSAKWDCCKWECCTKQTKTEAVVRRCSLKQVFLKVSQISQETPELESIFNKIAGLFASLKAWNFIKTDSNTGVFLLESAKYLRSPPVTASVKIQ